MALVIMDKQPTYFPPIFDPDYITGEHGVENPVTGAIYGAYGLTVVDFDKKISNVYNLWNRDRTFGSGYSLKYRRPPSPPPDTVEELQPEDVLNIVGLLITPETLILRQGVSYDLTYELLVVNKTSNDYSLSLSAGDLTATSSTLRFAFSQNNFVVASGTDELILLAVQILPTDVGIKNIQVGGVTEGGMFVEPGLSEIFLDPDAADVLLYQVNGSSVYNFSVGSPVTESFTSSYGIGLPEIWGVNDLDFLTRHGLEFNVDGILSGTTVLGPPETESVMVFVEQDIGSGAKMYASKILVLNVF
jgi:hypothetical protein